MRLTCPTCGARYEVADGLVAPGGQHVQCTACHARWFQHGPGREAGRAVSEDEILARLERRDGRTAPVARSGGREDEKAGSQQETEFRWERGPGGRAEEPRPSGGHLRVVAGADEARPGADERDSGRSERSSTAEMPPDAGPGVRAADEPGPPPPRGADRTARPAVPSVHDTSADVAQPTHGSGADLRPARQASGGSRSPARPEPARASSSQRLDLGGAAPMQRTPPKRRRTRPLGVVIILSLIGLLGVLYMAAEPLMQLAPWLAAPIESYVAIIDFVRDESETRIASVAESIRSAFSNGT